MGTNIHMVAEVRRDGQWRLVTDTLWKGWDDRPTNQPYIHRNYDVFAILADVRNGRGFAGSVTGAGFNPISEPKGVPEDADPATVELDEWDYFKNLGDHSFSWLTVAEMDAYDWDQVTTKAFSEREYVKALRTAYYIQHSWETTYRERAEDFLESLAILRTLGDPEDVRIVFGFDS